MKDRSTRTDHEFIRTDLWMFLLPVLGLVRAPPAKGSQVYAVFPSVQSIRLSPRTGRTPSLRPLDGTDAQLQSVLTFGRDGRPGPIGVLVYVSFSNFMSIMSVLLRSETFLF